MRSRHIRSTNPPAMRFTNRDLRVLEQIAIHRYLSSWHIQQLVFHPTAISSGQRRLQLLWQNNYLDRSFLPVVVDGSARGISTGPLYTLAKRGAEMVAQASGKSISHLPHTPAQNRRGYATLMHNLVATDLAVALTAASVRGKLSASIHYETETQLRRRLHAWRQQQGRSSPCVVPDGAFSLAFPSGQSIGLFTEVVRAGARGGNRSIEVKLKRYLALHRQGRLRAIYGHKRLRAVLIITTSAARAKRLLQLATGLSSGRGLFWFTSYEKSSPRANAFLPEQIVDRPWQDGNTTVQTIGAIRP